MKLFKLCALAGMAAIVVLGMSGTAKAYHDGGVAYCDGCHTMHNSSKGVKMTVNNLAPGSGNAYLLQGSDDSSTCLNCHAKSPAGSYHVATNPVPATGTAPGNYTPGGDFSYLQKSYTWTNSYGGSGSSAGERHGHNIIAADFGYVQDGTQTVAPGGSYPANKLGCQSCHDPHGQFRIIDAAGTIVQKTAGTAVLPIGGSGSYGAMPDTNEAVGVYRLLGGIGYAPDSYNASPFTANGPIAVAPATYNQAENADNKTVRVAYGSGMSEWCANCHTGLHNDAYPTNLRHPAGNAAKLTAEVISNYNSYVKSGDLTNTVATSYETLVPYEEGSSDRAALALHAVNDGSVTSGADTNSNVMCLSCHRAHATAWDSMTRWNVKSEFLTLGGAYPGTDATGEGAYGQYNTGKTQAEYQAAMNGKPASHFAYAQRSLCNKCHAKD
jgi:hypothetical protein